MRANHEQSITKTEYNEMVTSLITGAKENGINKQTYTTVIFFADHSWASVENDSITIYSIDNRCVVWFFVS